jgi:hypothetical protein
MLVVTAFDSLLIQVVTRGFGALTVSMQSPQDHLILIRFEVRRVITNTPVVLLSEGMG